MRAGASNGLEANEMRKIRVSKAVVWAVAIGLAAGGAAIFAGARSGGAAAPGLTLRMAAEPAGGTRPSFAPAVKAAQPALVNISSSKVVRRTRGGQEDLWRQFFGQEPAPERSQSLGSGVILTPDGYVLTNNHVIEGATDIRVTTMDKREFRAKLVGGDAKTDIALLKVTASGLPVITVGDSSKLEVGDYVLALGNPFGVGQTVTMGIVSALGRGGLGIEQYEDFIQTDAPINPGNSGGALVNERGELVGINTAILSTGGGSHGVGFAVPVNLARAVMQQLLENGKVTRAYLGVVPQDVTPAMAKAFGVQESRGALVGDVSPDGPAEKAGLRTGDIILRVNGKAVEDSNRLRMTVSMMKPDSTVELEIVRDGARKTVTARLEEMPEERRRASAAGPGQGGALEGVDVETLNAEARRELRLPPATEGVVVTDVAPESAAAEAGLRPGDVIQEVNRRPVRSAEEFAQATGKPGDGTLLLVNRGGSTLYVTV